MARGEKVETEPTTTLNVETVDHGKLKLHVWDVGGQEALRPHWSHHLAGTQGLVFVVDSADQERFPSAAAELQSVLESPVLEGVPVLLVANKADLPAAAPAEAVQAAVLAKDSTRPVKAVAMAATAGLGVDDGLQWLCEVMVPL